MSVVQICNVALARIGHSNYISSLDEKSPAAQNCTLLYEFCRDDVLRDGEWGFARRWVALALVADATFPGWTYVYRYPTNCLNARRVVPEGGLRSGWADVWSTFALNQESSLLPVRKIPFTIAGDDLGGLILTDLAEAYCIFTGKVTNPELFTPSFRSALAWRLAYELAMPLGKDQRIRRECEQNYRLELDIAKRTNLNEQEQDPAPDSISITGRW